MNFLRLTLCVLALLISGVAISQSKAHKPDAQNPATSSDQTTKEIVLIGELHGTQETPRLFSNLVTVAAREKNERIGVGLELPIQLQRLVDEAVKNNTTIDSFRQQLLADPAWQKIDDGRSSQAMLDLICDALKLAESRKVSLFFFDTSNIERDASMAQFIGQRVRDQGYDVTFILAGNIHANKASRHPLRRRSFPWATGWKSKALLCILTTWGTATVMHGSALRSVVYTTCKAGTRQLILMRKIKKAMTESCLSAPFMPHHRLMIHFL